jgi:hypothetical protein
MLAEHIRHAIDTVPLWNWALQAVGLETAYVGAELNARQRIGGFHVWLASNVALGVLHAATGLWLLFILGLLFMRVNIIGMQRWSGRSATQTTTRS